MAGLTRRGLLGLAAATATTGLSGCVQRGADAASSSPVGLVAVGQTPAGTLVPILEGGPAVLVDRSRVVSDAGAGTHAVAAAVDAESRWLAQGLNPGTNGRFADMARCALLDLRVMLRPRGALIDGLTADGGSVEPRVACLAAAALAACGHRADGIRVLRFLSRVQQSDGTFYERYPPDQRSPLGTPPALRVPRTANCGWALWATEQSLTGLEWRILGREYPELRSMAVKSFTKILNSLDDEGLPSSSGRPVRPGLDRPGLVRPAELATAAAAAMGLGAAVQIMERAGGMVQTFVLADAVLRMHEAIERAFAPVYPALRGGTRPSPAVTLLMPPFDSLEDEVRAAAADRALAAVGLPMGVLMPGRGLVATAELAAFALADVNGRDVTRGMRLLAWLDQHRTASGSLPGAVRFDRTPTGRVPSIETSALVLLAFAKIIGYSA